MTMRETLLSLLLAASIAGPGIVAAFLKNRWFRGLGLAAACVF